MHHADCEANSDEKIGTSADGEENAPLYIACDAARHPADETPDCGEPTLLGGVLAT